MSTDIIGIVGFTLALVSIIIVIWDHFKDDRQLTKEVQEYYEHIEKFVTSYIELGQLQGEHNDKSKFLAEFEYFKSIVRQRFNDFSKYLGLTIGNSRDSRYKDKVAYITKIGHVLIEDGNLLYRDPSLHGTYERHAIGNRSNLRRSEIPTIDNYFSDLRGHWQKFYHKTIFRPNLKKRINFSDFIKIDD